MKERKVVHELFDTIHINYDGYIDMEKMNKVIHDYRTHKEFKIHKVSMVIRNFNSDYCSDKIAVMIERDETDSEYEKRMEKNKRIAESRKKSIAKKREKDNDPLTKKIDELKRSLKKAETELKEKYKP